MRNNRYFGYNEYSDAGDYEMEAPREAVSFNLNDRVQVIVQVTPKYETDSNYGADADGNRGISVDFCEEIDFDDDDITVELDNGKILDFDKLSEKHKAMIRDKGYDTFFA